MDRMRAGESRCFVRRAGIKHPPIMQGVFLLLSGLAIRVDKKKVDFDLLTVDVKSHMAIMPLWFLVLGFLSIKDG